MGISSMAAGQNYPADQVSLVTRNELFVARKENLL
jgi:hypothetical protein